MKNLIQLFLVSMALLLGITAKAQNQSVIADGTVISPYVPLSGAFMSWNQRIQIIYPASEIPQTLAGHEITKMIFHSQNATVNWGQATAVHIKLMHTSASNLATDWENTSSATTVCTGVPLAISGNQVVFNFTTSFIYSGGNLLLEIETTPGITNNANFFGKNSPVTNVRVQFSTALNTLSFLPKLTIEHAPAICTVTFNKNSTTATGTMASQIFTGGVPQNLNTNTFFLTGHTFAGWATSPNGGVVYADGVSYTAVGNATLYAVWIPFGWLLTGNSGTDTTVNFIGTTDNQGFKIKTNNNTRMFITPSGNVGIATHNPQQKLEVNGNIGAKDNIVLNKGAINSLYFGRADHQNLSYGTSCIGFNAIRNDAAGNWTFTGDGANNGGSVIWTTTGGNILFATIPTTGANNKTLTDTQIKQNVKLQLTSDGILKCKEISVTLTGWPDYVFKRDYKLMTLSELEQFVSENSHLPNVPSAIEVEKNGVQLGEMNVILLKKIEELTLYILQLEKRLSDVEKKGGVE